MALEEIAERMEGKGWIGVGIGAVLLAPVLIPALSRGLRPAAKGAMKGYLALADRTRGMLAETGEQWQDLVAEAKAEYDASANGQPMMTLEASSEESGETADAEETAAA
jgi:hypothetical protein